MPVAVPRCPGSSVSPSPPAPALAGVIPPLQTWGDPTDGWLSWRHLMYNSWKWPPPAWLGQWFCPQHPQIPPQNSAERPRKPAWPGGSLGAWWLLGSARRGAALGLCYFSRPLPGDPSVPHGSTLSCPWGDISFVPSLRPRDISPPAMGNGLDTIYTPGWSRVKITLACLAA